MKKLGDVFAFELNILESRPMRYLAGYILSHTETPRKLEESPFKAAAALDKLMRDKYGVTDTLVKFGLQRE